MLAYDPDARIVTADFSAGDVVLFGMFTLHGSTNNHRTDTGEKTAVALCFHCTRD